MNWYWRVGAIATVLLVLFLGLAINAGWNNARYWNRLKPIQASVDDVIINWGRTEYFYHYEIGDRSYEGDRYREYGSPYLERGAKMIVYYDPQHPEVSHLSNRGLPMWVWLVASGFCVLVVHWAQRNYQHLDAIEKSKPVRIQYG